MCQLSSIRGNEVPAFRSGSWRWGASFRSVAERLSQEVRKFHHSSGFDPFVRCACHLAFQVAMTLSWTGSRPRAQVLVQSFVQYLLDRCHDWWRALDNVAAQTIMERERSIRGRSPINWQPIMQESKAEEERKEEESRRLLNTGDVITCPARGHRSVPGP